MRRLSRLLVSLVALSALALLLASIPATRDALAQVSSQIARYITTSSSDPTATREGQVYANTTGHLPKYFNGSAWKTFAFTDALYSSPLTTKGDMIAAAAGGTQTRLATGTDGFVLTADSSQTLGVKWALSAAGAPGGSSGQLQYNNAGAFDGFALAGDCTFSVPNITCAKTGGVSFAASATTNALNATNISSGTLAAVRGGLGTDASGCTGAFLWAAGSATCTSTSGSGNFARVSGAALTSTTVNGNTFTTGTYTLTGAAGKTFTFNNTLTVNSTDGITMTTPTTSFTAARTDAANTFTGNQTLSGNLLANSEGANTLGNSGSNRFQVYALGLSVGNTAMSNGEAKFGAGTSGFRFQSGFFQIGSGATIGWSSGDPNAVAEDLRFARDSAGILKLTDASTGAGTFYTPLKTITFNATQTIDFKQGNVQTVTLTGNITTLTLSNLKAGALYTLRVVQDGTGSRTVTWGASVHWVGGSAPTLSTGAGKIDIFHFTAPDTSTIEEMSPRARR
jgi:hypothetical protein